MCTNTRLIRNRYTTELVRVSCGKCPACIQEKAVARANRIRNHSAFGEIALFFTLTYSNAFLPYVKRNELKENSLINVYRDASIRRYRGKTIVKYGTHVIGRVCLSAVLEFSKIPAPRKMPLDRIAVCWYKDIQDFEKRLNINLTRQQYAHKISFFQCSEYGPTTKRPHFHGLLFIPKNDFEKIRNTLVKSWLFADSQRTLQYCEIARNAASYVSSYVNSAGTAQTFLSTSEFKQKHSYSKNFGVRLQCFSLAKILQKIDNHDLQYYVPRIECGVSSLYPCPIPKYVINRYFPKIKGYSLLAPYEVRELLLRTDKLCDCIESKSYLYEFSDKERDAISVRFHNIYFLFKSLGWSFEQFLIMYPLYYESVWTQYQSMCLKHSFDDIQSISDFYDFYDNISDVVNGRLKTDLRYLLDLSKCQLNPNARNFLVAKTTRLNELYYKMDKNRKIVNYAMSHSGYNV